MARARTHKPQLWLERYPRELCVVLQGALFPQIRRDCGHAAITRHRLIGLHSPAPTSFCMPLLNLISALYHSFSVRDQVPTRAGAVGYRVSRIKLSVAPRAIETH